MFFADGSVWASVHLRQELVEVVRGERSFAQKCFPSVACASLPTPAPALIICAVFLKIGFVLAFRMDLMVERKRNVFQDHISLGVNRQMVRIFNCMSHKFSVES